MMHRIIVAIVAISCCSGLLLPPPVVATRIKRSEQTNNTTEAKKLVPVTSSKPEIKLPNGTPAATAVNLPQKPLSENAATTRNHHVNHHKAADDAKFLHHRRAAGGVAASASAAVPPYVYFNKLISPDGKQQLKEFQLMAPNVVIESVQHDMNYGPTAELGSLFMLNAEDLGGGRVHAPRPKHHHKRKPAFSMAPFLYMLQQQMLQPNINLDLEATRSRNEAPIYQFLDNAVDNALRNKEYEKEKVFGDEKQKDTNDLLKTGNDELIVSCPVHHEHHISNTGDILDDNVVLVNECHIA